MAEKILTISIAAYNVENFLRKALDSLIIDEKYAAGLEVIIVNDGSTDNTKMVASKYCDKYPDIFHLIDKENGGYGSTINSAIDVARGKYFKQLDGDDWFVKNNLSGLIEYLSTTSDDLIITPYYKEYEVEDDRFREELIEDIQEPVTSHKLDDYRVSYNISMHGLTNKTDLLRENNIRITENCFYTDNEYVIYPLLFAESISIYDKPIYCYRLGRSGQSVSIDGAQKHYKDTIKVATNILSTLNGREKQIIRNKWKYFIEPKLLRVCDMVYTYHLVINNAEAKKELLQFDKNLRKHKYLYDVSSNLKKVKILRLSRFTAYHTLASREIKRWV